MLAQLTTVKDRLKITDTVDDVFLTSLIVKASGMFDIYCNRLFARVEGGFYEFRANEMEIIPRSYPIEVILGFELKREELLGWVPYSNWECVIRKDCIVSMVRAMGTANEQGRIFYNGGYVLPGTNTDPGQFSLPSEVELACVDQVAYWYQNRNRLGLTSVSGETGALQKDPQNLPFLLEVRTTLAAYRRIEL
jgi:hypothetical protein